MWSLRNPSFNEINITWLSMFYIRTLALAQEIYQKSMIVRGRNTWNTMCLREYKYYVYTRKVTRELHGDWISAFYSPAAIRIARNENGISTEFPARFATGEKRLRPDPQNVRSAALSMSTEYPHPRRQHRNSAYKRDAAKRAQWRSYNFTKSRVEYVEGFSKSISKKWNIN